ncbi:hypothetical protein BKA82DRAFT_3405859 [Pisolithus tinctorius]|nr:hypothetical protein BKA82DRAFT_3405859 [Pisolithus tinctorius]
MFGRRMTKAYSCHSMITMMDTWWLLRFCKVALQVWVTCYLTLTPAYHLLGRHYPHGLSMAIVAVDFFYLTRRMTIYRTIHPRSPNSECHPRRSLIIPRLGCHSGRRSRRLTHSSYHLVQWISATGHHADTCGFPVTLSVL